MTTVKGEAASRVLKSLKALGAELAITDLTPISGGKQNYVLSGTRNGEVCVLKVTDSRHRSLIDLETQLAMLAALKHYAANVCVPLSLTGDSYIQETIIEGIPFYLVAYPYAAGKDVQIGEHSQEMGQALAELHVAMQQLPRYPFAEIGRGKNLANIKRTAQALKIPAEVYSAAQSLHRPEEIQLLHGDFSAANLKIDGLKVNVFDFDNCIYGLPAYELANTLYMVLFDEMTGKGHDLKRYRHFRQGFLAGYMGSSLKPLAATDIDAFIDYRVLMLAAWLHSPDGAPLFIRQASPAWLETLHAFVKVYFSSTRDSFLLES
jgi:Ser/Thr protein kinase RdoA (MazF antagonist)